MVSRVFATALVFALTGCGARTELSDSSGAGGTSSSTTSDTTTSSTSSSGGGGAGGGPCTWGFGPVVDLDAKQHLWGAVVDGDHLVLVTGDADYYARSLSFDLATMGATYPLTLPHNDGTRAPTFAAGFGHAVAIVSDAVGCRAVVLGADGFQLGGLIPVGQDGEVCFWSSATPSGFLTFSGKYSGAATAETPLDALLLNPDATTSSTKSAVLPASPSETVWTLANVVLDDGSVVLVWGVDQTEMVYAQRFSSDGAALTGATPLFPLGYQLSAVSLGSSVLLTWNDEASPQTVIRAATLDGSMALGPTHVVATASVAQPFLALASGGRGPGSLLVSPAENGALVGRWLASDGSTISAPFTSNITPFGTPVALVATPDGPVLVASQRDSGAKTVAQRVVCR